jgi:hypothetical protein
LAAKYGVEKVKEILDSQGFFPVETFGFPFIFFVTLLRFTIGNLLHIRKLEDADVSPYVWLSDFLIIFVETIILLLLGIYCYGNVLMFLILLMVLCFLDCFWILIMVFTHLKHLRPEVPWKWGLLNLASGLFLFGIIFHNFPLDFRSWLGNVLVIVWFSMCGIIDILFIDHYKLLKE